MGEPDTPYEAIGGDSGVRALVARFYDAMETRPDAAGILALHDDLSRARQRLYEFLSGWLGGPPIYVARHGHPRMRARHLRVPIGPNERDAWLRCMEQALAGLDDPELAAQLFQGFARFADHMRNDHPR